MANGVEVATILRRAPELGYEVLPGVSKRRSWNTEEKLRILAEAAAAGLVCLGIFRPVELRQTGLERRHWDANEADERGADCCAATAD